MFGIDDTVAGEVDIAFGILGKRYFPQHIRAVLVLLKMRRRTQGIERIAGCLGAQTQLNIRAIRDTLVKT